MTSGPDPRPSEESSGPKPLDYESPPDPIDPNKLAGHFSAGAVIAMTGVGIAGAVVFLGRFGIDGPPPGSADRWALVGVFVLLGIGCTFQFTRVRRRKPSTGWQAFKAGVLIGLGLAALVEGICFGVT